MKNGTQIIIPFPDYPLRKPRAPRKAVIKEPVTEYTPHPQYEVSEIEIAYKPIKKIIDRPQVKSSLDAAEIGYSLWDKNKIGIIEQFSILFMNNAGRLLAFFQSNTGGITSTISDKRPILALGLKVGATSMIAYHNHPSCQENPSNADDILTDDLSKAGKAVGIPLRDHIVLTV